MSRCRTTLLAVLMLLGACGERDAAPVADAHALQAVSFDGWQQALAARRGTIVVVDFWASWCTTCIERFPAMVAMSKRYREQGVQFLSLNVDDPNDAAAIAWSQQYLRGLDTGIAHYRLDENLMQAFERLDLLGIPVVRIYDKGGTEAVRLTGDDPNNQFDDDDVATAIQRLLAH